ncbi:CLUMA_CG008113, isoform A [Clunio marinus]|uniref:CLUMA_CG008113, isoform A n=1 Tax=Clunio marinus TaxID=568069 RepID=A0A1J1I2V2_9DIPT|nr:CLUMA_CG008113, isoform A [Clunio marinus]
MLLRQGHKIFNLQALSVELKLIFQKNYLSLNAFNIINQVVLVALTTDSEKILKIMLKIKTKFLITNKFITENVEH